MTEPGANRIFEPFGPTNRSRRLAAAGVVMGAAVPVGIVADHTGGPPPRLQLVLLIIGVVALIAWLVDGRSFLGPGAAAFALGLAITIARETVLEEREYTFVFGFLGAACLLIHYANPKALKGFAGLLFCVSVSTVLLHTTDKPIVSPPVLFPAVLLVWGGTRFSQAFSDGRAVQRERVTMPAEDLLSSGR